MNCDEIKLKLQAITDNELDEKEIPLVFGHIENCYRCRNDYIELLQLQRKMNNVKYPEPPREWFEDLYKNIPRKISSAAGKVLLLVSYVLLLVWFVFSFFIKDDISLITKVLTGGVVSGLVVLFAVTLTDRLRERKDDKYKGVIK